MSVISFYLDQATTKKILREAIIDIYESLLCVRCRTLGELVALTGRTDSTIKKALNQAINLNLVCYEKKGKVRLYTLVRNTECDIPPSTNVTSNQEAVFILLLRNNNITQIAEILKRKRHHVRRDIKRLASKGLVSITKTDDPVQPYYYEAIEQ